MIVKTEWLLREVEALHASSVEELKTLHIEYLSKKGAINNLMADFRNVAVEQEREVGMKLDKLKTKVLDEINTLEEQSESQDNSCGDLDLIRSTYPIELDTHHSITIVKNGVVDIFACLGLSIIEDLEIEDG